MKKKITENTSILLSCANCQISNTYQTQLLIICFPDGENEPSEVHIGRMLQILREFADDPVLSSYVIDDIWDDMKAMRVCPQVLLDS